MKKPIRRVMGMSILLVGLMTYAGNVDPKPGMGVKSIDTERILLYAKEVKSTTSVQIKDAYGVVIYTDKVEVGDRYRKIYDIASLPVGTYYLKIIDAEYSKVYSVVKDYGDLLVKVDFSSPRIDDKMLAILMN